MVNNGKVINVPLRYPGRKDWLVNTILDYIPNNTKELVSPFLGSGAIELNLALYGVQIHGYDICKKLINFWNHWLDNPMIMENEAKGIMKSHTPEQIHEMKPEMKWTDDFKSACWFYVYNRLTFGSITNGSHIKAYRLGDDGRLKYPEYIGHENKPRNIFPFSDVYKKLPVSLPIKVDVLDCFDTLDKHGQGLLCYLDPPYIGTENLYGLKTFNHQKLYEYLKDRKNWILSYNDDPLVYQMYSDFHIQEYKSRNFKDQTKEGVDTLIFSKDLTPPPLPEQLNLFQ